VFTLRVGMVLIIPYPCYFVTGMEEEIQCGHKVAGMEEEILCGH